jgi:DNA-binding NtrC family response regulator
VSAEDGLSLLLVDDDPVLLRAAGRILSRHAKTMTADSAAAARVLLAEHRFDVVVSDYAMPGEDGLSLLAFVRELYPEAMLILFSGDEFEHGAEAVLDGRIHEAVPKAVGFDPLVKLVQAAKQPRG